MARAASRGGGTQKKTTITEVEILQILQGETSFWACGTSPLIFNRMTEKAMRTLLMGGGRKNAAEKAANVKHDPIGEYRASVYRNKGDDPITRLRFPCSAFKGVVKTAALDMPGATKAEMGRRVWVPGLSVDVYGIPQLMMSVVRSAGMDRVPDIRTRAICSQWCCEVRYRFAQPLVTPRMIASLFVAGGILCGIGDWRQEKGSGSFGQFRMTTKDDAEVKHLIKTAARLAQDKALEHYTCFDEDSEELLQFYQAEIIRLGRDKKSRKDADNDEEELDEAA